MRSRPSPPNAWPSTPPTDTKTLDNWSKTSIGFSDASRLTSPPIRTLVNAWSIGSCRRRRALAGTAGAIVMTLALYGLWNVRPVNVPTRRPITASPVFQGALHNIKNGSFQRAIGPLLKLANEDPCPLVMFYLSLASMKTPRASGRLMSICERPSRARMPSAS